MKDTQIHLYVLFQIVLNLMGVQSEGKTAEITGMSLEQIRSWKRKIRNMTYD